MITGKSEHFKKLERGSQEGGRLVDGPDLYPRKDMANPLPKSLGSWHLATYCVLSKIVDSGAF